MCTRIPKIGQSCHMYVVSDTTSSAGSAFATFLSTLFTAAHVRAAVGEEEGVEKDKFVTSPRFDALPSQFKQV